MAKRPKPKPRGGNDEASEVTAKDLKHAVPAADISQVGAAVRTLRRRKAAKRGPKEVRLIITDDPEIALAKLLKKPSTK